MRLRLIITEVKEYRGGYLPYQFGRIDVPLQKIDDPLKILSDEHIYDGRKEPRFFEGWINKDNVISIKILDIGKWRGDKEIENYVESLISKFKQRIKDTKFM